VVKIIDGKFLSKIMMEKIAAEVAVLKKKHNCNPKLSVILVGNSSASEIYVNNKMKACIQTDIESEIIRLDEKTKEADLLTTVERLNMDKDRNGILVQLPLPAHIDENKVINAIASKKDVDGFTPDNAGRLFCGLPGLIPCTAAGIIALIKSTDEKIEGKHVVIVGRSNIVGKPTAMLLLHENATVTMAHSKTRGLSSVTRGADILVVAIGKKEFIRGEFIKPGAIVIDVGINREEGKLFGDVCFSEAEKTAAFITPVPGGVGPMTIAMLMENTVKDFKLQHADQ
jgi:methylenetetrahydrofolate dehydrogenase (NADP+)/methenyltetrahydrofolate cyclohydrolase